MKMTKKQTTAKSKGKKAELSKAELRAIQKLTGKPNPNSIKAFRYGRLGPYTEEGLRQLATQLFKMVGSLSSMVDNNAAVALKSTVECGRLEEEKKEAKKKVEISEIALRKAMEMNLNIDIQLLNSELLIGELNAEISELKNGLVCVYRQIDSDKVAHLFAVAGKLQGSGSKVPDALQHFLQISIKVGGLSFEGVTV